MRTPFTTRISSRGQVVIPGPVRKALAIEPGTTFLVLARKDTVVLHRCGGAAVAVLRCHGEASREARLPARRRYAGVAAKVAEQAKGTGANEDRRGRPGPSSFLTVASQMAWINKRPTTTITAEVTQ